jgi:long-chain acyl-CoA synthetase
VGYFQGDIKKLTDDIATLRPTVFAGVPRVYTRVYDKVMQVIGESSWLKRTLFETAFKSQVREAQGGEKEGSSHRFGSPLLFPFDV